MRVNAEIGSSEHHPWGFGGGAPSLWGDFAIFLIKMPHYEAYLNLNFYQNLFIISTDHILYER